MTWAHALETGSADVSYRLVIEGWPLQFVSDSALEGTLDDGRERVVGLERRGLRFTERVYPAEAKLELTGFKARIGDVEERASEAFSARVGNVMWLAVTVDEDDTAWTVNSTAGVSVGDRYHVGTECVRVVSVDSATTLTVARGEWDTIPQAHERSTGGDLAFPAIADVPLIVTGRRAWLYAHGPTETATSATGTLVFKGVLGAEPTVDGPVWELLIDPVTRLLDQDIAGEGGEFRLRGIYYPANAPFVARFSQWITGFSTKTAFVSLWGFWPSNNLWCIALTSAINDALTAATFEGTVEAYAAGDADWFFVVTSGNPSDPTTRIEVEVVSGVDGHLAHVHPVHVDDPTVTNANWYYPWAEDSGTRSVPRMSSRFGAGRSLTYRPEEFGVEAEAPRARIYLDRAYALAVGDVLRGEATSAQDAVGGGVGSAFELSFNVASVDGDAGWITWNDVRGAGRRLGVFLAPRYIANAATYRRVTRLVGSGTVADLRDALVATSPARANGRGVPLLTDDDLADWQGIIGRVAEGRAYLSTRRFEWYESAKLAELLQHEFRLAGVFPVIEADYRIGLRELRTVLGTETLDGEADVIVVSRGFGSVEFNGDGVINLVEVKTGYNAAEDDHEGPTFRARDVASISAFKKQRTLEIAPKVAAEVEPSTPEDARSIAEPVLGFYGRRYAIVSVDVGPRAFGRLLGSAVRVVSPQLPEAGRRGLDASGLVVGREWDLGRGVGRLRLFVHDLRAAGYAPTGRVLSQSSLGSNRWTVTLEANRYAPTGRADAAYFAPGDAIRLYEWGGTSSVTGTVESVAGDVVTVALDSAWTPGVSTWNFGFGSSTAARDEQFRFAFVAGPTLRIDQGSGASEAAQEFAP